MGDIHTMGNEELVQHVWDLDGATALEVELAERLEDLIESYNETEELALNLNSSTQLELPL